MKIFRLKSKVNEDEDEINQGKQEGGGNVLVNYESLIGTILNFKMADPKWLSIKTFVHWADKKGVVITQMMCLYTNNG